MTLTELFTDIADAIRGKEQSEDEIPAMEFAERISNLPTGGGEIELPDGYTRLHAISNTGLQYIDTGYVLKAHDEVESKWFNPNASGGGGYPALFGARNGSYQNNCYAFFAKFRSQNNMVYSRTGYESFVTNTIQNKPFILKTKDNKAIITIDEETNEYSVEGTIEDCINTCGVFTLNTSTSSTTFTKDQHATGTLYYFKVTGDDGEVKLWLIPALETATNAVGMYDIINDRFLTPRDGGAFAAIY